MGLGCCSIKAYNHRRLCGSIITNKLKNLHGRKEKIKVVIKRLNSKNTKALTIILSSPEEKLVWRDWLSYWKCVRMASNMGGAGKRWRGTYRNRGLFTRRLALTLIRIEI